MPLKFDVAVVGCGLSGMWAALRLAQQGFEVALINKGDFSDSSTYRAQGGIAVVSDADDTVIGVRVQACAIKQW